MSQGRLPGSWKDDLGGAMLIRIEKTLRGAKGTAAKYGERSPSIRYDPLKQGAVGLAKG